MKTVDEYFESRNGGKSADEMAADGDFINPVWAVGLMKGYYKNSLREELFNFNKWMCGKQYDGVVVPIKKCIEEYLKSKL